MDYPEMAELLGVNSLTAKFHVGNVLLKLGASNRSEAIDAAVRRHLVA
jgi:DNA-binding CsgD family transcriptional regulator